MAGDLLSAIESNAVVSVSQVKEKKCYRKAKKGSSCQARDTGKYTSAGACEKMSSSRVK